MQRTPERAQEGARKSERETGWQEQIDSKITQAMNSPEISDSSEQLSSLYSNLRELHARVVAAEGDNKQMLQQSEMKMVSNILERANKTWRAIFHASVSDDLNYPMPAQMLMNSIDKAMKERSPFLDIGIYGSDRAASAPPMYGLIESDL